MLSKALYETLTTYDGTDQRQPRPGLAEYSMSPEGNWLTLRLRRGSTFSDGSAVTSDDVEYTLERAKGLRGAAASILGNVTVRTVDERTVTLTSPGANFALPAILANPALGILNSRVVKANGGTIGPGDTADTFLATTSAGSGPYVLSGVDEDEVRLTVSPTWAGAPPAFPEVVVRDVAPDRQVRDIGAGRADVALDLSPDQADGIAASATGSAESSPSPVSVMAARSSTTAFLMLHRSPAASAWTGNPDFVEAVRLAIDRSAMSAAVHDSIPAAGIIPVGIVGSLLAPTGAAAGSPATAPTTVPTGPVRGDGCGRWDPATTQPGDGTPTPGAGMPTPGGTPTAPPGAIVPERDLRGARAALARSGYRGQVVPLTFASDLPIQGVPTASVAALVSVQLAEAGIVVRPTPLPAAKALARYRDGRDGFSLWSWSPDYTDPENYLAFAPGGLVALRAGWALGSDPEVDALTDAARRSVGDDRATTYAAWQQGLDRSGPFVPLFQPSSHLAHGQRVSNLPTNAVWTLDLAGVR